MENESKSNTNAAVMGGLVLLAFIGVGYLIHWSGKQGKDKALSGSKSNYARIEFNGSKTYMVVDGANQCRFTTTSAKKAKNFLAKLLKAANES